MIIAIYLFTRDLSLKDKAKNCFVSHESQLIKNQTVLKAVNKLKKEKYIYKGKLNAPKGELEKDWKIRDQLLFKSTLFGDDTDRSLTKGDGSWTYFAGDLAYHAHKLDRKFDILINILALPLVFRLL